MPGIYVYTTAGRVGRDNYFWKKILVIWGKWTSHKSFHCGDCNQGKLVTAVHKLKEHDCGNATDETEKDAEVDN